MVGEVRKIWDNNKREIRYEGFEGKMYCFSDDEKSKLLFTVDKDDNVEMTVPVFVGSPADCSSCNADLDALRAKGWIKDVTIKGKLELDRFGERAYIKQIEPNPYLGPESTVTLDKTGVRVDDKKQALSYYSDGKISFKYKANGAAIGFFPNEKLQYTNSNVGRFVGYNEDGSLFCIKQGPNDKWKVHFDGNGAPINFVGEIEQGTAYNLRGTTQIESDPKVKRFLDMVTTIAEKRTALNLPVHHAASVQDIAAAQTSFDDRVDRRQARNNQQQTNRRSQNAAVVYYQGR